MLPSINRCKWMHRRLGWDPIPGEGHLDAMLRGELMSALVSFGHEESIAEAKRRFSAYLSDRKTSLFPPDIRVVRLFFSLLRVPLQLIADEVAQ